ncbi:MAG TPA: hypothetical protein VGA85_06695 [Dehalococcoidales bacterium]
MENNTILKEYDEKHIVNDEFTNASKKLLIDLLDQYNIRVHFVDSRLKGKKSLERKLTSNVGKYKTIEHVPDICGLRIITYYPDEIDTVSSLIKNEFDVDPKRSSDKRALIAPDRFGYISVHFVVKLSKSRLDLAEYRRFSQCQAEIQVRSILQHAWAEIEHDLGYKPDSTVPPLIRRRFSRLASLLEIADDEFMKIRDDLNDYEKHVEDKIRTSPTKVPLNPTSIKIYMNSSKIIRTINSDIERTTHVVLKKKFSTIDVPSIISRHEISYLRYVGLKTIADVDSALKTHRKLLVRIAKKLMRPPSDRSDKGGWGTDICVLYLAYAILVDEGSLNSINKFFKKFMDGPDSKFARLLLNARQKSI